ncbi:MAG TPA: hypothetical protein VF691_03715 [Cytophagaceae bacterium]
MKQDFVISFKKNSNSYKNFGSSMVGTSISTLELQHNKVYILRTDNQIITIPQSHISRMMYLSYN